MQKRTLNSHGKVLAPVFSLSNQKAPTSPTLSNTPAPFNNFSGPKEQLRRNEKKHFGNSSNSTKLLEEHRLALYAATAHSVCCSLETIPSERARVEAAAARSREREEPQKERAADQ